jgi:hypothetical protein
VENLPASTISSNITGTITLDASVAPAAIKTLYPIEKSRVCLTSQNAVG